MSQSSSTTSTAKSAVKVMAAILGSRVLGLLREIVFAAVFGAGREMDAFLTAFRIPNLLRDLFAEGALSTAFVTIFSKKLSTEGKESAFRLANIVFTAMYLLLGILTIAGVLASPWLVDFIAFGFHKIPGKAELTVELTRILFPFILLVSLAAVYMGLLNSLGSFGLPASASTVFNAVSILAGLGCGYLFDPALGPRAIYGFAIGTVLGGAAQLVIQIPRALSFGFRPQWILDFKDPGLLKIGQLMLPAIIGGAAVQVNVLVNTSFASTLGDGAISWLNNAFRLMQLPIGMFGVAIAMVILPRISHHAVQDNLNQFGSNVFEGLRFALFLTLPSSIGLALLAEPIIGLLFQRGAFSRYDVLQSAAALQAYAIGLSAYACIKVLTPAFYALDLPKIPLRISLFGILFNILLNSLLIYFFHLGIVGLALSTSCVALINMLQLVFSLNHRISITTASEIWHFFWKLALACIFVALDVWLFIYLLKEPIHSILNSEPIHSILKSIQMHGLWMERLILLLITVPLTALLFWVVALLLDLREARTLLEIVRRKLKKSSV